jgi:hypothetical protein
MTVTTRRVALAAAAVLAAAGAAAAAAATVQAQPRQPTDGNVVQALPDSSPNKWTEPEV